MATVNRARAALPLGKTSLSNDGANARAPAPHPGIMVAPRDVALNGTSPAGEDVNACCDLCEALAENLGLSGTARGGQAKTIVEGGGERFLEVLEGRADLPHRGAEQPGSHLRRRCPHRIGDGFWRLGGSASTFGYGWRRRRGVHRRGEIAGKQSTFDGRHDGGDHVPGEVDQGLEGARASPSEQVVKRWTTRQDLLKHDEAVLDATIRSRSVAGLGDGCIAEGHGVRVVEGEERGELLSDLGVASAGQLLNPVGQPCGRTVCGWVRPCGRWRTPPTGTSP
jgi:hypothetical protein